MLGNAKTEELRQEVIDAAITFLETFQYLTQLNGLSPGQVKVMDKTYLLSSPWHKHTKHICPKGSIKSRKITPEKGSGMSYFFRIISIISYTEQEKYCYFSHPLVNEIFTTLSADGKKGPFYVSSKDPKLAALNIFENDTDAHISYVPVQKHPVTRKNIRPAERSMLAYLDFMINKAKFLKKGMYFILVFFIFI